MVNDSGMARPTAAIAPCGLMLIAIDGAMSPMDRPMTCHSLRLRRSPVRSTDSVVPESGWMWRMAPEGIAAALTAKGVVGVAVTIVDNSGVVRVKAVPV